MKIPRIKARKPADKRLKILGGIALLGLLIGAIVVSHQLVSQTSATNSDRFGSVQLSGGLLPDSRTFNLGLQKIAEMTAMVRHSEPCPEVPQGWSVAFIALMAATTPTEEQVRAQERKTLTLRDHIGQVKWCQLYSVEMQEAYAVFRFATHSD